MGGRIFAYRPKLRTQSVVCSLPYSLETSLEFIRQQKLNTYNVYVPVLLFPDWPGPSFPPAPILCSSPLCFDGLRLLPRFRVPSCWSVSRSETCVYVQLFFAILDAPRVVNCIN